MAQTYEDNKITLEAMQHAFQQLIRSIQTQTFHDIQQATMLSLVRNLENAHCQHASWIGDNVTAEYDVIEEATLACASRNVIRTTAALANSDLRVVFILSDTIDNQHALLLGMEYVALGGFDKPNPQGLAFANGCAYPTTLNYEAKSVCTYAYKAGM